MLARRIKPLFDRVLIKRIAAPKQTAGGLYLPESAQGNDIPQGIVEACGPGLRNNSGEVIPLSLKVGDTVLLPNYGGQDFKVDDDEYTLLRENEIIATLDPQ